VAYNLSRSSPFPKAEYSSAISSLLYLALSLKREFTGRMLDFDKYSFGSTRLRIAAVKTGSKTISIKNFECLLHWVNISSNKVMAQNLFQ
jgi:hypothetical protein